MVQQNLDQLNHFVFPAILILNNNTACVLYRFDTERQTATVYFPEMSDTVTEVPIAQLQEKYLGSVIYLQQRQFVADNKVKLEKTNQHWFWSVIRTAPFHVQRYFISSPVRQISLLCVHLFFRNECL